MSRLTAQFNPDRIRAAVTTALVVAVGLVGCAAPIPTDSSWTPREPASVSQLAVAGEDAAFEKIDPTEIEGLVPHHVRNAEVGVDLRWPLIAGADELNRSIQEQQWSTIKAQETASGTAYLPQAQDTGFGTDARGCVAGSTTIPATELLPTNSDAWAVGTCEFVAATGSMLGIRWRTVDAEGTDQVSTTYYDVAADTAYAATELFDLDEQAENSLWNEAVKAVRLESGALTLWPTGGPASPNPESREQFQSALDAAVLQPDGSLVLDVPGGLNSAELDSLPGRDDPENHDRIRFTPEAIAPVLNETGQALLDDLANETPWQANETNHPVTASPDCTLLPCVAITYDDGPNPAMSTLLDTFAERDALATFFFLGNLVSSNADIVQRTHDEGHELANHSWNHPDFTTLKPDEVRSQIDRTQNAISGVTGTAPTLFRPPYGAYNNQVLAEISMPVVMWDHDTFDWQKPGVEALTQDAINSPKPGSIVLMHSIHDDTVEAAPAIIDGLHDRGFVLVTVTELFNGSVPSGVVSSTP
ncbi:MAG: polysaccharide deacetylase family protein [Gulosibacter sp.]|uniref:polysaccharide deacetylase family protein n=1 Tax=Gulosibacter sp. TaxID=2817531 RepID=UPI003F90D431